MHDYADLSMDGGYDSLRPRGEDGLNASGDSFELCGGLHPAPNGHNPNRSPAGWAASGSPGLPTGNGLIQKPDPGGVEIAAAAFVSLGVDPHSEGVFAL